MPLATIAGHTVIVLANKAGYYVIVSHWLRYWLAIGHAIDTVLTIITHIGHSFDYNNNTQIVGQLLLIAVRYITTTQ